MAHRGKRSKEAELKREQKKEAYSIRNSFGKYHDNILKETIQCQTPEELHYYLALTFPNGVYECAIPETTIQGLVLNQKLTYTISY